VSSFEVSPEIPVPFDSYAMSSRERDNDNCNRRKPFDKMQLEHKSGTLRLLVTTVQKKKSLIS